MTSNVLDHAPTGWGHTWRVLVSIGLGVLIWASLITAGETAHYRFDTWWPYADLAIGALLIPLLLLRRSRPLAVALVLGISGAFMTSTIAAAGIAVISLCTHRVRRDIVLVGVTWLSTGVVFDTIHHSSAGFGDRVANLTTSVLALAFAVAVGLFIGARRELVAQLHERAETAEREQELRISQARVGERARIAREMHDVLAHRISLVAMHSGALSYRTDLSAEQVRETASLIQESSHQALEELREVLGILREPGVDQGHVAAPLPTLADLPRLIDSEREAGAVIDLATDGDLVAVPSALSRNGFRIVQECLTNARKHAPAAPIAVRVAISPDTGVRIEVANPVPKQTSPAMPNNWPRSGLGLVGLTERVDLSGGELTYGVDRGHRFVVCASLPWERADHG